MMNLKKTAVAVLALGSSVAFAGTMGPVCVPGSVTVPCEMEAWDFGIQALYLKAALNSSRTSFVAADDVNGTVRLVDNNPSWGWGFKLEGSYHFSTGNDLNLNWYHLNDNKDSQAFTGSTGLLVDDELVLLGDRRVHTVDPRWDAVNLEFGQHVNFGQFKNIRFHGGVQYARIKTDTTFSLTNVNGVVGASEGLTSKFTGFGPRVGADMSYEVGNGLAVYANSAMALLAGKSRINATEAELLNGALVTTSTLSGDRTAIVPELEAKLGAKYSYAMAQGDFILDAGYMWVNYINAQTVSDLNDVDFGVHGPYVGVKWIGSVV